MNSVRLNIALLTIVVALAVVCWEGQQKLKHTAKGGPQSAAAWIDQLKDRPVSELRKDFGNPKEESQWSANGFSGPKLVFKLNEQCDLTVLCDNATSKVSSAFLIVRMGD